MGIQTTRKISRKEAIDEIKRRVELSLDFISLEKGQDER